MPKVHKITISDSKENKSDSLCLLNRKISKNVQDLRGTHGKEVPMVLLGNKGDMVHLRQVSSEEGKTGHPGYRK